MPIDHSSMACVGSSAGAAMRCEEVSYERSQILFSWSIGIRLDEVVNAGLRPDWFSRPTNSVVADWRRCFASAHATRQLAGVTIIKVCSGHVGSHDFRPCSGRWVAGGKGSAGRHRLSLPRATRNTHKGFSVWRLGHATPGHLSPPSTEAFVGIASRLERRRKAARPKHAEFGYFGV